MSEMGREDLLEVVRRAWETQDPVPTGLVAQMQAALALEATDLDVELMELVELSSELVGARGAASYTLQFRHDRTELMLRIAGDGTTARVDGWIVPSDPVTVRVIRADDRPGPMRSTVGEAGRFALSELPDGLVRLRIEPHDPDRPDFVTPAFEI